MRNLITIAFTITFFVLATTASADSKNKSPEFAVKKLLGEIKQIVKKDSLSDIEKEKNKKHSDIALSVLKVSEISQKALGKYWSKHSEEQQNQFQALLGNLFVHVAFPSSAKFFANLDVVYGKPKSKKDMMVVPLTVVHEKEGEVDIDFRMKQTAEHWQVVDVILDGVSMRNNLRSQFYKILRKNDFKDLVRRMKKKLKETD
jgi:phospholipid transport system substrate-binding protein